MGAASQAPEPAAEPAPTQAPAGTALPVALVDRPLTLPQGTLRIDTSLTTGKFGPGAAHLWLHAGAGFGITEDIEAGAIVLPLRFAPNVGYGDLVLYGVYRLHEEREWAAGVRAELVLPIDTDAVVVASLPVLWRASSRLRIDSGLQLSIRFATTTGVALAAVHHHPVPTRSTAGIPLVINYNITDNWFFGGRTGITVGNFGDFGDTFHIPLGLQAGYTIDASSLLADVGLLLQFPGFVRTADGPFSARDWRITLSGDFYFDVM